MMHRPQAASYLIRCPRCSSSSFSLRRWFATTSSLTSPSSSSHIPESVKARINYERVQVNNNSPVFTSTSTSGSTQSTSESTISTTESPSSSLVNIPPLKRSRGQTFYHNRVIESYLEKKPTTITLRTLIYFGRHLNQHKLIQAANYVRTELPTRIAHRIRDFQQLPFVVGTNPHIEHVYDLYWNAFDQFRRVPEILNLEDNDKFCQIVQELLKEHLVVIPQLALGIMESSEYFTPEQVDKFMNTMLRSRISRRVLAEQHIALTQQFHSPFHFDRQHDYENDNDQYDNDYIGVVYPNCNAQEIISKCASFLQSHFYHTYGMEPPQVVIDGHTDTTFAYIPDHMEYIFYEILKNSMRYTIERYYGRKDLPPIVITICSNDTDVIVRVSDQAGGISPPEAVKGIWSWAKNVHRPDRFVNFEKVPRLAATMMEQQEPNYISSEIAKMPNKINLTNGVIGSNVFTSAQKLALRPPDVQLGIGLPMSRVYAEYWGGGLDMMPMENWGTDTYVRINRLGNREEKLEA